MITAGIIDNTILNRKVPLVVVLELEQASDDLKDVFAKDQHGTQCRCEVQDDGHQHALLCKALVLHNELCQFKMPAAANGQKFCQTLDDAQDDGFDDFVHSLSWLRYGLRLPPYSLSLPISATPCVIANPRTTKPIDQRFVQPMVQRIRLANRLVRFHALTLR